MNKAFLLLFLACIACACEPLPYSPHRATESPLPKNAFVHLVVVSSPSPSVEVSISNQVRAVVPRRGISPRMELSSGNYPLLITGGGSTLCESSLQLLPGSETLLIASAQNTDDKKCPSLVLSAYPLGQRDPKLARVRLLHSALDAPMLELVGPSGEEIVDGIAAGAVSAYGGLASPVAAGSILRLRSPLDKQPLFDVTTDGLSLGSASTWLGVGEIGPLASQNAFGLLSFDEESGALRELSAVPSAGAPDGEVLLFHASKEVGSLVAKVAGKPLFSALSYPHASPLATLASGLRTLSLEDPSGTVWTGPLRLWPGRGWLLFLYGTRSAPRLVALPRPALAPQTVWRVLNLVDGLDSVDLLDGDDAMVSQLGFGAATAPTLVDALRPGTIRLRDRGAGNRSWDIVLTAGAATASLDQVVTLVLLGSASSPRSVSAQLVVESRAGLMTAPPVLALPTTPSL